MERDRRNRIAAGLLATAVAPPDTAAAAWASLPGDFDLDEIWDPHLGRLLGAAGRALAAAGVDDPAVPRLAGIARKNWVELQLERQRWEPVVAALSGAGFQMWVLGAGLLADVDWAYGGRRGERWAGDTRIAVRRSDVVEAAASLRRLGVIRRSATRIERRAAWYGGMPIQFDDGRWGELSWAPTPWWPVDDDAFGRVASTSVAGHDVALVAPAVAAVATSLDLTFGAAGPSGVLDLHRIMASGAVQDADVARCAEPLGARGLVSPWLDTCRRLAHPASMADVVATIDASVSTSTWDAARRSVAGTSFRLGRGRSLRLSPQLLAERWHLDRPAEIPTAFGRRVVDRAGRISRRRG